MAQGLSGPHLIVLVFLVLLLFGAPKLPALAKSLGQSVRVLKREVASEDPVDNEPQQPGGAAGANS